MDNDSSGIRVKELRCSLVWISLFTKGGTFRVKREYYNEFKNAANDIGEWSVPWTENPRVVFWEKYLEIQPIVNESPIHNNEDACVLSFTKATGCVVPLRSKNLCKIDLMNKNHAARDELTVWSEGFAYPHGVTCIITLRWRSNDGLNLTDMADRLIELRNGSYQLSNATICNGKGDSLNDISRKILNHLSIKSKGDAYYSINNSPYTVVTVVEAENVPLAGAPEKNGLLHKVLDAFCTLNRRWSSAKTSDLNDALLRTKGENENDVLYARGLGRAVWLPAYFRQHYSPSKRKPIRYLGRYHRNITLATMQTAYLSLFLKWVNEHRHQLKGEDLGWAKAAAGAVARLYGRCKKSYMSKSLPIQILPFTNVINAVRAEFIPKGSRLGEKRNIF